MWSQCSSSFHITGREKQRYSGLSEGCKAYSKVTVRSALRSKCLFRHFGAAKLGIKEEELPDY